MIRRVAALALALALGIWFAPSPDGVSAQAWHLFAIFIATILSVVIGAFPILTASILGLASAVLTGRIGTEVPVACPGIVDLASSEALFV